MEIKVLEEIGFSKGEIKTYLALLELGEATIGPISKKASITPAKTYPILNKLQEKGLITYIIKNDTMYFQLLNPERILVFLEDKEKKLNIQKQELKQLIPKLSSIQKQEAKQYATVYETFNGIKTLYDEILNHLSKNKEDFIGFTLGNEYQSEQANLFFKNYDAKRKNLRIKTRLMGLENQRQFFNKNYPKDKNIEIRFLNQALPTGIIIYGNNVATLLWNKTPIAFVISSKQNADSYKKFFEDLWKIAKK